jgi:hypothetical protein
MASSMRLTSGGDRHRSGSSRQIMALGSVMRKTHGFLVGLVDNRNALHADRKAGRVCHDEHVFRALVLLTHQETDSAASIAKLQHSGRALALMPSLCSIETH